MFRLEAQSAGHLTAIGGIDPSYCEDGDEEQYQNQDTQWFGYPIIERIVFRTTSHGVS